jgi:hypothetical protein
MNHYAGDNCFWHPIVTANQQSFRFRGITPFQANGCVDAAVQQSLLVDANGMIDINGMIPINFRCTSDLTRWQRFSGTESRLLICDSDHKKRPNDLLRHAIPAPLPQ